MTTSIKLHHHNEMKSAEALAALSGALPALGIVACVLGVVKTMGAIDQPPPVLGALIGGALVGTFLGVFMAYGIFEPFAQRLKQIIDDDGEILKVAQQIILGNMHGYPVPLIIEGARVCISHDSQPTFGELFDALRK
jgi:chemotaxis protein MotA